VFESLLDYVSASPWTYAALFAIAALDAVFPLVPSETAAITAGVVAATGGLELPLVVAAAAGGALVGDNGSYALGRTVGTPLRRRFFSGEKANGRIEWAERQLEERGGTLILVARFIPGGRTAVTFAAGLVRYQWIVRFLLFTLMAALAWALYAVLLGYFGGHLFEDNPLYGLLLALGLALIVAGVVEGVRHLRRRHAS
jgi:membrane-associated protein